MMRTSKTDVGNDTDTTDARKPASPPRTAPKAGEAHMGNPGDRTPDKSKDEAASDQQDSPTTAAAKHGKQHEKIIIQKPSGREQFVLTTQTDGVLSTPSPSPARARSLDRNPLAHTHPSHRGPSLPPVASPKKREFLSPAEKERRWWTHARKNGESLHESYTAEWKRVEAKYNSLWTGVIDEDTKEARKKIQAEKTKKYFDDEKRKEQKRREASEQKHEHRIHQWTNLQTRIKKKTERERAEYARRERIRKKRVLAAISRRDAAAQTKQKKNAHSSDNGHKMAYADSLSSTGEDEAPSKEKAPTGTKSSPPRRDTTGKVRVSDIDIVKKRRGERVPAPVLIAYPAEPFSYKHSPVFERADARNTPQATSPDDKAADRASTSARARKKGAPHAGKAGKKKAAGPPQQLNDAAKGAENEEANNEKAATDAAKKGEAKKGEAKKGEAKKGEAKKGEAKKGEAKKGEAKKEAKKGEGEAKKGEAKRGEAKKGEAKKGEAKKEAKGEAKKGEAKKDEAKNDEATKDEPKKDEATKDEPKKEAKKGEAKKDEHQTGKQEAQKDGTKREVGTNDDAQSAATKDETKTTSASKDAKDTTNV